MKHLLQLCYCTLAALILNNNLYSGISKNNYSDTSESNYVQNCNINQNELVNYISAVLQLGNVELNLLRNENINNTIKAYNCTQNNLDIQYYSFYIKDNKSSIIQNTLNLPHNDLSLTVSESYSPNNFYNLTNANEILNKTYIVNTMLKNDIQNTLDIIKNIPNSKKNSILQKLKELNISKDIISKFKENIQNFQDIYNFIYNLHFNDHEMKQVQNRMKNVLNVALDYFDLEEQLLKELGYELV